LVIIAIEAERRQRRYDVDQKFAVGLSDGRCLTGLPPFEFSDGPFSHRRNSGAP
jgi:hypothetical protein